MQFTGKACIGEDLEDGDITLKVKGSVIVGDMRDNQDGTVDRVYKCKIVSVEVIEE